MKGFIALVLASVPEMVRRRPAVPLHLAFTHDEETGCFGAPALIDALPKDAARPMLAIVGEPTSMQIANAQKGCSFFRTRVTGLDGHSSAPDRGVSAIAAAAEIIAEIGRLHTQARSRAQPESGFDPPHTTLSVGTIAGGSAVNIIARECSFEWDLRTLPQDDAAALKARLDLFVAKDLLPRMRQVHPQSSVATETIVAVPPLKPAPGSPAEALARQLTGANTTTTVSFASEAGLIKRPGSRRSSAARARSTSRTSPTNTSRSVSLRRGKPSSIACSTGRRRAPESRGSSPALRGRILPSLRRSWRICRSVAA
jgi:acetylornithine deacetylase